MNICIFILFIIIIMSSLCMSDAGRRLFISRFTTTVIVLISVMSYQKTPLSHLYTWQFSTVFVTHWLPIKQLLASSVILPLRLPTFLFLIYSCSLLYPLSWPIPWSMLIFFLGGGYSQFCSFFVLFWISFQAAFLIYIFLARTSKLVL